MGDGKDMGASPDGDRAGGLRPEPAAQSRPKALIPSAGKLWFASAVLTGPDIRTQNAWGNAGHDATFGYLVAECRKEHPNHAINYTSVIEVDVERKPRREEWKTFALGLAAGLLCGVVALTAQAIDARRAETGTGSVHESAVGNADAPNTQVLRLSCVGGEG